MLDETGTPSAMWDTWNGDPRRPGFWRGYLASPPPGASRDCESTRLRGRKRGSRWEEVLGAVALVQAVRAGGGCPREGLGRVHPVGLLAVTERAPEFESTSAPTPLLTTTMECGTLYLPLMVSSEGAIWPGTTTSSSDLGTSPCLSMRAVVRRCRC